MREDTFHYKGYRFAFQRVESFPHGLVLGATVGLECSPARVGSSLTQNDAFYWKLVFSDGERPFISEIYRQSSLDFIFRDMLDGGVQQFTRRRAELDRRARDATERQEYARTTWERIRRLAEGAD